MNTCSKFDQLHVFERNSEHYAGHRRAAKSRPGSVLGSCWHPCVARIPSHWPLVAFLIAFFKFDQTSRFGSNSRRYAGHPRAAKSRPSLVLGSCWRPCVARIPSHWPLGVFFGATHTSIRTSRLEGRRAGRCILRRRDSRCVVSERHRAGVLGLGSPMHGELARPASPHEVGEGALTAVCPPAGPNLPPAQ